MMTNPAKADDKKYNQKMNTLALAVSSNIAASAETAVNTGDIENVDNLIKDKEKKSDKLYDENTLKNIVIIKCDSDDAWARDTGATYVYNYSGDDCQRIGIDWSFNAWGGDYNGLYSNYEKDDKIAKFICDYLGDECISARPFVLEGGSIHVDGEGTLITTEECLLSKGRNPNLSKEDIENKLKFYLGVKKIIWLPFGIYNDETDGHIDNMCAFTGPAQICLAWTEDENDPQYERSRKALEILENSTDAKGRKFKVHKLLIPKMPIVINEQDLEGYEFEDGEDVRELGERLAASYANFYITNKSVLLPIFNDVNDKKAIETLEKCFPKRKIKAIYAREIIAGGGNIHCITQQIPIKI